MLLCLLSFSCCGYATTMTDARWGVNNNNVLRLVAYLDNPADYKVELDGKSLKLLVNADAAGNVRGSYAVRSNLADKMIVKQDGAKAVVQLELLEKLNNNNLKSFVIKQDLKAKTPYRVVLDVSPNATAVVAKASNAPVAQTSAPKANQPVVSNQPIKKPANTGSTWQPSTNTSTSNGSWTDRFRKDRDGQTSNTMTPSERVKQSIANAKKQQIGENVGNQASPAQAGVVVAATIKPQATNQVGTDVTQQKGALKKMLTAKQNARREAAAAEAARKKDRKNKNKNVSTVTQGVTTKVEDGITYIKGTGIYRTTGGIKDKVITIDAGHGGSDPGAIGASGVKEKNITLPIAKNLCELLQKAGAKVHMTRTTDVDVHSAYASDRAELQARVNVAEKYSSDIFISIHINSSVNKSVGGIASYYNPKTAHDARLARAIQNKLSGGFQLENLGIREANFYVNKRSSMPATLLELCFVSNPKEEKLINTGWFQTKAAQMIFEGVKAYFN